MRLSGAAPLPLLVAMALLPALAAHADSGVPSHSGAGKYSLVPYVSGSGLRLPQQEQRGPRRWTDYLSARMTAGFTAEEVVPSAFGYSDTTMRVQGIGNWPMTQSFSFDSRVGLMRQDYENRWDPLLPVPGLDRGTDLSFGIGLKYQPSKNLDVRLGYDHFDAARLEGQRPGDSNIFSLGVKARF